MSVAINKDKLLDELRVTTDCENCPRGKGGYCKGHLGWVCRAIKASVDGFGGVGWKRTADEYPEEGEPVLVVNEMSVWHIKGKTMSMAVLEWDVDQMDEHWFLCDSGKEIYGVTHWMKLPEYPHFEEDELG